MGGDTFLESDSDALDEADFTAWLKAEEEAALTPEGMAERNRHLIDRQWHFRLAADAVTEAFAAFAGVEAVALFGSVARSLWKEVPRFQPYRRERIALWHECKDVDIAVWLSRLDGLRALNRARNVAVGRLYKERQVGVANHQVDVFVLEPGTDRYLGRLCGYSQCPKGKPDCRVPGCGDTSFLRQHQGFRLRSDALAEERIVRLYDRRDGILRRAAELPRSGADDA